MSLYTCGKWAFGRKRKDQKLSKESKNKIAEKMNTLAVRWQRGDFKNVKDAGWNNFETFEWLWRKYTHKELDFAEFPAHFKDVRKFEFGLNHYNKLIAKPQ